VDNPLLSTGVRRDEKKKKKKKKIEGKRQKA